MLLGIPTLVLSVALPLLAVAGAEDRERLRYGLQRMTEVAVVASRSRSSLVTVVLAAPVVPLLFGERLRGRRADPADPGAGRCSRSSSARCSALALVSLRRQRALAVGERGRARRRARASGSSLIPAYGGKGAAAAGRRRRGVLLRCSSSRSSRHAPRATSRRRVGFSGGRCRGARRRRRRRSLVGLGPIVAGALAVGGFVVVALAVARGAARGLRGAAAPEPRRAVPPVSRPRVVVLRGHSREPVGAAARGSCCADRFDVSVAVTGLERLRRLRVSTLARRRVRALRDRLPRGRLGDLATLAVGDRYLGLEEALAGADIVHSAELGVWFSGQPAAAEAAARVPAGAHGLGDDPVPRHLPRVRAAARYRRVAVAERRPLPRRHRARTALPLLEGVDRRADRRLAARRRRRAASAPQRRHPPPARRSSSRPAGSSGRRATSTCSARSRALARDARLLDRRDGSGAGAAPAATRPSSDSPTASRSASVPYEEMPAVFASASCVVLASLPIPLWEEQFGMVLAEAMAAGAPIVASASGAIPEVLEGSGARLFTPGDWPALAGLLDGQLTGRPSGRGPIRRSSSTATRPGGRRAARGGVSAGAGGAVGLGVAAGPLPPR